MLQDFSDPSQDDVIGRLSLRPTSLRQNKVSSCARSCERRRGQRQEPIKHCNISGLQIPFTISDLNSLFQDVVFIGSRFELEPTKRARSQAFRDDRGSRLVDEEAYQHLILPVPLRFQVNEKIRVQRTGE